jgi:lipopolysaccharide export system permease protein
MKKLKFSILQRYVLKQFLEVLLLCLIVSTALFIIFDFFERIKIFIKEDSTMLQAASYLIFKIPMIVQLMTPIAVLIATLISIGRLSQNSEITAMRACGVSLFHIAKPLLLAGLAISLLIFVSAETIIPWSSQRVEEIYNLDIRKKDLSGKYSRTNFWYRDQEKFYNIGLYDSRTSSLHGFSMFVLNSSFLPIKRVDATQVLWKGDEVGWTMIDVVETTVSESKAIQTSKFDKLPLVIKEKPNDFYNSERRPETMSFFQLSKYIAKLRSDGISVTQYLVDRAAKLSFPLVNVIVVLIAFPFALAPARSGTMTVSFIAGISIGFGYYIVHALSTSFGGAELIPILPAAWTANIILGSIGGYLMAGADYS